jgi:hypothetical protein
MLVPDRSAVRLGLWTVLSLTFSLSSHPLQGQIQVLAGTYGGNVGAPYGNVTDPLATQCNGALTCNYTVSYLILGDPVPGKQKDYAAKWQCVGDGTGRTATAPPEAGLGSIVTLSCQPPATNQLTCYTDGNSIPPATHHLSQSGTSAALGLGATATYGGIGVSLSLTNLAAPTQPLNILEARSAAGCGLQFADWTDAPDNTQALTNQSCGNSTGSQWGMLQAFSPVTGTALTATDFAPRYSDSLMPPLTTTMVGTTPCPNGYPTQPTNYNAGSINWVTDTVPVTLGSGAVHNLVRLTASYSLLSTRDEHWLYDFTSLALYLNTQVAHDNALEVYLFGQAGWIEGPLQPQSMSTTTPIVPTFSIVHGTPVFGSHPVTDDWWYIDDVPDHPEHALRYVLLKYNVAGAPLAIAVPMQNLGSALWSGSAGYCTPSVANPYSCGSINLTCNVARQQSVNYPAGSVRTFSQRYYVGSYEEVLALITPPCSSFSVTPAAISTGSAPGSSQLTVTGSPAGCLGGAWTTSGNGSWITAMPASTTGSGSATVSWSANSGGDRTGSAIVAGRTITVNQDGVAPTISAISPTSAPMAGGTAVTIAGTNFRPGVAVTIGGNAIVTSVSPTSIVVQTPPMTSCGTYTVVVSEGRESATLPYSFTYTYPAAPSGLSPSGVVTTNGTATLTWQSVAGATEYAVRLQDNTDGSLRYGGNNCPGNPIYVCVNGWPTNAFTVSVVPGHTYTWWVQAGCGGQYSGPTYGSFTATAPDFRPNSAYSNDVLSGWPAGYAIDGNLGTDYSSAWFASNVNDRATFIAVWLPFGSGPYAVSKVKLFPRQFGGRTWCFPQAYDVYVTSGDNSRWVYVGRYTTQPQNGVAVIDLGSVRTTYGVLIQPTYLSADNFGNYYFQMAEISLSP